MSDSDLFFKRLSKEVSLIKEGEVFSFRRTLCKFRLKTFFEKTGLFWDDTFRIRSG